jgi:hypothetical protein
VAESPYVRTAVAPAGLWEGLVFTDEEDHRRFLATTVDKPLVRIVPTNQRQKQIETDLSPGLKTGNLQRLPPSVPPPQGWARLGKAKNILSAFHKRFAHDSIPPLTPSDSPSAPPNTTAICVNQRAETTWAIEAVAPSPK